MLDNLPKVTKSKKKRVGRGTGSGKGGHTAGRGAKGTKARYKIALGFTGTKRRKSFLRKIPFLRGKGRFKPLRSGPVVINVGDLERLPKNSRVNLEFLIKQGYLTERSARFGAKILGQGKLKKSLTVALPVSAVAAKKIKAAGGKVELI